VSRRARTVLFAAAVAVLLLVSRLSFGSAIPVQGVPILIFSALVMLSFVTCFLEHFFTKPTDVLTSSVSILLVLSPLGRQLGDWGIWYWVFYVYNVLLALTSLSALLLLEETAARTTARNRASAILKHFSVTFGNGRLLFGALFFLSLVFHVDSQSPAFLWLAGFALLVALADPRSLSKVTATAVRRGAADIGEIIGVQSKNVFIARLYRRRRSVRRFDLVEFRYSMDEEQRVFKGMIIDNYLLNEQQWVKVLSTESLRNALAAEHATDSHASNVLYKLHPESQPEFLERFVGVVVERATIDKLRFEYAGRVPVAEGTLLEVPVRGTKVLYQIIQGITEVELLESKNETGYVVGEAVQLGEWNQERCAFDRHGWVPDINTPVFTAAPISPVTPPDGEYLIGTIPGTNYPILMNMSAAISHHVALLGVTGCGKSVFARELVRQIVSEETKVICVDFTNECREKLTDLGAESVIAAQDEEGLFEAIDVLSLETAKFKNQQNATVIAQNEGVLRDGFFDALKSFLESDRPVALFELPDVSNTTGILDYTRWFFRTLFEIARKEKNFGKRVCVVLEEAHTVVPEWNFIGVEEKKAQSLVNSIGQIALQGRKYRVGFIVIAQRTANVSKTVLTQCNSVIAFQQFDRTSSDFLANYMGTAMVGALPTLQFRQAIAVGKAFRSGVPLIFQVPEIVERDGACEA